MSVYNFQEAEVDRRAILGSDEEEDQVQETRIDVEVPKIKTDLGKEIHFVKLPNFLSMESRPFDPENYEDELDDESLQQQVGLEIYIIIWATFRCYDSLCKLPLHWCSGTHTRPKSEEHRFDPVDLKQNFHTLSTVAF